MSYLFDQNVISNTKIQETKKVLVMCQRVGDLFLFGLVWQYSSVQTKYNNGRVKPPVDLYWFFEISIWAFISN
jgi:hypothetical protein